MQYETTEIIYMGICVKINQKEVKDPQCNTKPLKSFIWEYVLKSTKKRVKNPQCIMKALKLFLWIYVNNHSKNQN